MLRVYCLRMSSSAPPSSPPSPSYVSPSLLQHPVTVGSACTLLPDGAHSAQFSYTLDTPPVPQINVWMTANCSGYTSATYVPTGGFGVCQGPTFGSYLSFELNCVRYTGYSASRTPTPSSSPIPTATPPNLRYCTQVTESLYYLQAEYDANSCSGTPDVRGGACVTRVCMCAPLCVCARDTM